MVGDWTTPTLPFRAIPCVCSHPECLSASLSYAVSQSTLPVNASKDQLVAAMARHFSTQVITPRHTTLLTESWQRRVYLSATTYTLCCLLVCYPFWAYGRLPSQSLSMSLTLACTFCCAHYSPSTTRRGPSPPSSRLSSERNMLHRSPTAVSYQWLSRHPTPPVR